MSERTAQPVEWSDEELAGRLIESPDLLVAETGDSDEYREESASLYEAARRLGELRHLKDFARAMISPTFEGLDINGGDIQDEAAQYGLLERVTRTQPCSDKDGECLCAEIADFPTECYRFTAILEGGSDVEGATTTGVRTKGNGLWSGCALATGRLFMYSTGNRTMTRTSIVTARYANPPMPLNRSRLQ